MRTAPGLGVIAIGAILAFAVTSSPSFLNLQIAGWVIMLTGVAGIVVPRRGYGWMRRRVVVRRPRGVAMEPRSGRRAFAGQMFHRNLGPGLPAPAARLTETTIEQSTPATAQPAEETVEEYFQE
jgi:uncharacterized protein DUF6458